MAPVRATVHRLRLGLEASRPVALGSAAGSGTVGGAVLTPTLEVGVRHGGDAETGVGLDLGGALALSVPERGLRAELRGPRPADPRVEGLRRARLLGRVVLRPDTGGPRRLAVADPHGGGVVLGRCGRAARAHHAGRAGGQRPRRRRPEEPPAGAHDRLRLREAARDLRCWRSSLDSPAGRTGPAGFTTTCDKEFLV